MSTKDRLGSLDVLRGVAIALVVAFHVSVSFPTPPVLQNLLGLGNLGVQLFFLISAVTMCHMWEQRQSERSRTVKFFIRRWFRIAPPFWFALLFYTTLRLIQSQSLGEIGPWDLGLTALFLHGFSVHSINLVVPGGWSIAVEMSFYLVFPFLVQRFRSPESRILLALGLWGVTVALTTLIQPWLSGGDVEHFLYYSLLTQLPIFPLGMALYSVVVHREKLNLPLTLGALGLWLAVAFAGKSLGILTRPFLWLEVFLLAGFMAIVLQTRWRWSPLEWMGRWSYSIYLFHFAVIELAVAPFAGRWLTGVPDYLAGLCATIALTSLVAWISSRTLEAWSATWGKALVNRVSARRLDT